MSETKREGHIRRITNALISDEAKVGIHFTHEAVVELLELLKEQPERKKGKWIKKMRVTETEKYTSYDPDWYCACCGAKYDPHIARMVNFCYVCGADMRGEKE